MPNDPLTWEQVTEGWWWVEKYPYHPQEPCRVFVTITGRKRMQRIGTTAVDGCGQYPRARFWPLTPPEVKRD